MNYYYAFLGTSLTVAAIAVALHLIFTLRQLKSTAREVELLMRKANGEMDKVQSVTAAVSSVAGVMGGGLSRTLVTVAGLVYQAVRDFRRKKGGDDHERE